MDRPRTIIAGSQTITDYDVVTSAIDSAAFTPGVVLPGTADGVDTLGEQWADRNDIPVERYPPSDAPHLDVPEDADQPPATIRRNIQMAEHAEALIAVWNGDSPGTERMIEIADQHDLRLWIHRTDTASLSDF